MAKSNTLIILLRLNIKKEKLLSLNENYLFLIPFSLKSLIVFEILSLISSGDKAS